MNFHSTSLLYKFTFWFITTTY